MRARRGKGRSGAIGSLAIALMGLLQLYRISITSISQWTTTARSASNLPQEYVLISRQLEMVGTNATAAIIHNRNVSTTTTSWHNEYGLVHVLRTRFQQKQPSLMALGRARLQMFREFCLPSILRQTTKSFLWLIYTDPELDPKLRQDLLDLVRDWDHILVIASNHYPEGFRQEKFDKTKLWSGNQELLKSFHQAAQSHPVLESRLDADDGLNRAYLSTLQRRASETSIMITAARVNSSTSSIPNNNNWRVWCADPIIEWQHYCEIGSDQRGELRPIQPKVCVTPGLTWGYALGTKPSNRTVGNHFKIYRSIPACTNSKDRNCHAKFQFDDEDDMYVAAIRARTPISAGLNEVAMMTTSTSNSFPHQKQQSNSIIRQQEQDALWHEVEAQFGLSARDIQQMCHNMEERMLRIMTEAIQGQCITGGVPGTCKKQSTAQLQALLEQLQQRQHQRDNATTATVV